MGELRRVSPRKTDMDRAVKLALANGLQVTGVQVRPDGGFTILTAPASARKLTALEQWEAEHCPS